MSGKNVLVSAMTLDTMSQHLLKPPSLKQLKNERALTIYAAFLIGLILFAVFIHRLHTNGNKQESQSRHCKVWVKPVQ